MKREEMDPQSCIRFVCNICGMRAPQPVLCTKDECLTTELVNAPSPSPRKH